MTKVVLLIGGPSTGTRFRPLSLERAKPMFMVAGHPLVWHHLKACTKLPNLTEVILLGFYTLDAQWSEFLAKAEKELGLKIRYPLSLSGFSHCECLQFDWITLQYIALDITHVVWKIAENENWN